MKKHILAFLATPFLMNAADLETWRPNPTEPVLATATDLETFRWAARPIIVMADQEDNLDYQEQLEILEASSADVEERDILIVIDSDPEAMSKLRQQLQPEGFAVYLVGKDGSLKFQSESPVEMARFNEIIDDMPMRQREMEDGPLQ